MRFRVHDVSKDVHRRSYREVENFARDRKKWKTAVNQPLTDDDPSLHFLFSVLNSSFPSQIPLLI